MSQITNEQASDLIAFMRGTADRFRERARAVATLAASAAGALTAGLVFSTEGQSFPGIVRFAGIIGIVLLAVSVCFFLSASLYYARDPKPARSPAVSPARQGSKQSSSVEEAPKDPNKPEPVLRLLSAKDKATAVRGKISERTEWGKGFGVAGLFFLMLMLPLAVFLPEERSAVSLQMTGQNLTFKQCPLISGYLEGEVRRSQLSGSSTFIPIAVPNKSCDGSDEPGMRTVYFVRNQVLITVLGNS